MKLLIVTVQYKQVEKTIDLIDSIFINCPSDVKPTVVVVDNAYYCEENSDIKFDISSYKKNVLYIPSNNIGYFPGLNLGILSVENYFDYDCIISCNNDVILSEDFLKILTTYKDKISDNVFIVPKIYGPLGEEQNPQYQNSIPILKRLVLACFFQLPPKIGYFLHKFAYNFWGRKGMSARNVINYDASGMATIYLPLGAFFIFSPNSYQRINYLPEDSFLYGEEMFLRKSLVAVGGSFQMSNKLVIFHSESATTSHLGSYHKWMLQRCAYEKYKWFYLSGR